MNEATTFASFELLARIPNSNIIMCTNKVKKERKQIADFGIKKYSK